MTVEERNEILETADILRALGGQNGFSNLQPKIKRLLIKRANALKEIVENDIRGQPSISSKFEVEEFDGETEYLNSDEKDWSVKV